MRLLFRSIALYIVLLSSFCGYAYAAQSEQSVVEARFQSALRSMEIGDYGKAIAIYQSILAQDPNLTRVRLELALAYFFAEQWSRSRSEFFRVLSGDIPDPVRRRVLGFIREIDARRGFEWDLEVGFKKLGSTRNYDTDQIELRFLGITLPTTLDRSAETAFGVGYSASVLWRNSIDGLSSQNRILVGFGEVFSVGDLANDRVFRDVTVGVRGGARLVSSDTTVVVSPVVLSRFTADEHFEDRFGLEASFERRNLNGYSVFGSLVGYRIVNRISSAFSGYSAIARLGGRRSFGGRSTVGFAVYGETKSTDTEIDAFTTVGLEIFGSFDVGAGFIVEPQVYFAQKSFNDVNPLFTGDPNENQYGIRLRVEKRDLILGDGFVPFFGADYKRVDSGIDAFSYDETLLNIGITRAF